MYLVTIYQTYFKQEELSEGWFFWDHLDEVSKRCSKFVLLGIKTVFSGYKGLFSIFKMRKHRILIS